MLVHRRAWGAKAVANDLIRSDSFKCITHSNAEVKNEIDLRETARVGDHSHG